MIGYLMPNIRQSLVSRILSTVSSVLSSVKVPPVRDMVIVRLRLKTASRWAMDLISRIGKLRETTGKYGFGPVSRPERDAVLFLPHLHVELCPRPNGAGESSGHVTHRAGITTAKRTLEHTR